MRIEDFKGALLSTLIVASLMVPAISLFSVSPVSAGGFIPHAPIYIDGNDGFTPANGVTSGSGTENDPYIIENWDIDISKYGVPPPQMTPDGIVVRNTNAYFIIRDCYVHDGEGYSSFGIYFDNVMNGKIDNAASDNNNRGIFLSYSSNNDLEDCVTKNNNYGISIFFDSNKNDLENCTVFNNKLDGIGLSSSNNNNIMNCTILNNSRDIYIGYSWNNNLRNNAILNNTRNFVVLGSEISHFYHDIDTSNTVNGKPIYYMVEQENLVFDGSVINIGFLGLVSCENIRVENLNICNNHTGALFVNTSRSTLTNCNFENNREGIRFQYSSKNVITNCTVLNDYIGICIDSSSNNSILNSTASNNEYLGINLEGSSENNIMMNCTVSNNQEGIQLLDSSNNNIENCTLLNNHRGIFFYDSNNNLIFHNNFINNTNQARDDGSNYWDNGYPWGGNYWSDYTGADIYRGESQNLLGSDWIGDTPYYIPGDNNRDHYPLMNPFPLPYTGWARVPPILVIMIYPPPSLHTIYLEMNLALYQGSKLVVKFYTWGNEYEDESVIENFVPPWHVKKTEVVPHPGNLNVKRAKLDLTTDNTENVISTIVSFILRRDDLFGRIMAIKGLWPFLDDNERNAFFAMIMDIKGKWPIAPS